MDEKALLRCVTIVNSMMRTSRHRKMNSLISGLLENVVRFDFCVCFAKIRYYFGIDMANFES